MTTPNEELVRRAYERRAAAKAGNRSDASAWRQFRNRAKRSRAQRDELTRERRRFRAMNGTARAGAFGTTLGGLVVLAMVDGKQGGRSMNVAYTPGEAARYAIAVLWRALIAWWEA